MKHTNILCTLLGIALCAMLLSMTGCAKDEGGGTPNGGQQTEVFNFSTRATYTLNVNYDVPSDYEVYFEVYTENPLTTDQNGAPVMRTDIQPIDKGFTDGKGSYSKPIVMNSAVETLYIYTPYIGVPKLLTCKVQSGVLSAAELYRSQTGEGSAAKIGAETRTIFSNNITEYPNITTLTLGTWRQSDRMETFPGTVPDLWQNKGYLWGRPDYLLAANQTAFPGEGTKPALEISADIFKTIRAALPGDGQGDVDPEILKNGAIHVTKNAEVDLYYIAEGGAYENVLAYYCYPTGNAPTDPSQIKAQVIAIPNAKTLTSHYYYINGILDYGALIPGEGIRLHYIDESGVDKGTEFPAGTSIGWILYSNGFKHKHVVENYVTKAVGVPTVGLGAIYSDSKLMNDVPHMAVFRHGDFIVTAFEDCIQTATSKCDYDDVIFHVESTPADAIIPGIPDKDPDAPANTTVSYRGILSFEDNWPYRGDFDMNDVVVSYKSDVVLNSKNQIVETTDYYTVLWSGATYNNDFAVENKNVTASTVVTFEGGDGKAVVEGNILRAATQVLDYANQADKKTLKITCKFTSPIEKENFIYPPYNPFITARGEKDREVHLTNMTPTSNAKTEWLGYGHDSSKPAEGLYYITYDENGVQMPFAIDIMFNSDEDMAKYVIPAEKKSINEYYPGFLKWLQSGGKTDKNWYLYPRN